MQDRTASASPCRVPVAELGSSPSVIWTYDGERGIRDSIHDIISRARRTLLLASFSLNGMTEHPELLLKPLERAMRTHCLQVSLLVRARNNHPQTRHGAIALADLGVRICADSLTHAKAVISDERHGALFSANFDADHGLLSGAEVGVRLDGNQALEEAVRHLQHAMAHANLTFAPNPTQTEMDVGLGAWWRTPWPLEPEITVICSDAVWRQFVGAATSDPVLYSATQDQGLILYAGDSEWTLTQPDATSIRTLKHARKSAHQSTKHLLEAWLSTRPQQTPKARRGFCTTTLSKANNWHNE